MRQQQLAAHRHRDDPAAGHRRCARCRGLLYGPDHPYGEAVHRHRRSRPSSRALTRDELSPSTRPGSGPTMRPSSRSATCRCASFVAQLESAVRQLAAAGGGARHQGVPGARRPAGAAHRPDRPAAIAAVASSSPASCCPPRAPRTCSNLTAANEVLGGNFLARINMDLRERRGWSYGAFGSASLREHQVPYIIQAPVQADRTGESIAAVREDMQGFLDHQRRDRRGAAAGDQRQHPPAAGPVRDIAARCSARCARTRSTTGPTIIGRRSPTAIAG